MGEEIDMTNAYQNEDQPSLLPDGNGVQGKVALIVDGADADGRSLALALAKNGANLAIVHYGEEEEQVAETKRLVEAQGQRCCTIQAADRGKGVSRRVMKQIVAEYGRLDIFIDNTPASAHANGNGNGNGKTEASQNHSNGVFPSLNMFIAALGQIASPS